MFDFIDLPQYVFLLSFFPICGLYISKLFDPEITKKILIASLLLLVSRLTGYVIVTDWLYALCILFILSLLYAFFIKTVNVFYKTVITFILVPLLLLSSLIFSFFNSFGEPYEQLESSCRKGRYKVETVRIRGFSGRGVTEHKLYYYPVWILVYKNIETISIDPFKETKECVVSFNPIILNSCLNKIE